MVGNLQLIFLVLSLMVTACFWKGQTLNDSDISGVSIHLPTVLWWSYAGSYSGGSKVELVICLSGYGGRQINWTPPVYESTMCVNYGHQFIFRAVSTRGGRWVCTAMVIYTMASLLWSVIFLIFCWELLLAYMWNENEYWWSQHLLIPLHSE